MYSAADPYLNIHKKPPRSTHRLAPILESRAAEQAALREQVFSTTLFQSLPQPSNLTIVDIGCGTGAIARELARRPNVRTVLGIDPAPYLIEEAHRLAAADPHANKINGKMEFRVGLGAALPVGDGIADLAVIWTGSYRRCGVPQCTPDWKKYIDKNATRPRYCFWNTESDEEGNTYFR